MRFLSAADDGTLCYACDGVLWVRRPGAESQRLRVTVRTGAKENAVRALTLRSGATQMALSPNEDEVAFVVRGEVFVASVKHGTTRRITSTPEQERTVAWGPEGRTLFYAAERAGSWNLYRTELVREDEKFFFRATLLKEQPVLVTKDDTFQPVLSPDGKSIAYLKNRDTICVLDLASKTSKVAVPGRLNYSYADGDTTYSWSPDGRFLAATFVAPGAWIEDVVLVHVASGKRTNVTLSGYFEWAPRWSAKGDALLFLSNRLGRRSHGSWGSDDDVFAIYLTQEAYDRARLDEEEYALWKDAEKERKKKEKKKEDAAKKKKNEKDKAKDKKKDKKVDPVRIEFRGIEKRTRRLTIHSAPIGGFALSPDGEKLVYWARIEKNWDLWIHKIRKSETKRLYKSGSSRGGDVVFNEDGDAVFIRTSKGAIRRVSLEGKSKSVGYAAEMTVDQPRERAYILGHVWRQTRAKFYDTTLHGVDWNAVREHYEAFLPHIFHGHDFAELLSEMVGELNASHTGSRYRIPQTGADATGSLGILFDVKHRGAGLKVGEIVEDGPVDRAGDAVPAGSLLTSIDGVALVPQVNPDALLNRKAGKRVRLTFRTPAGKTVERVVRPIGQRPMMRLLYRRWVKQRRVLTDQLSRGRLGYVHVPSMNDSAFRTLFRETLGRHRAKEGLVVDTRFNGGGWLHDDLVKFLGGKPYALFAPPRKAKGSFGGEPRFRWSRPVVVIQNEGNYSDGHVFPWAFKKLGIGKLVGTPVAGTGTAVWWERQIDRTISYGIPQVGFVGLDGKYLENMELAPDFAVYHDPESVARGDDKQLKKAVEVLLAQLKR